MTEDMKTGKYTRLIVTLLLFLMCGGGKVWADDITIFVEKSDGTTQTITGTGGSVNTGITGGSVAVAISGRDVTLTVTPAENYKTKKDLIVVEKMTDPSNARRRALRIGRFPVSGTDDWVTDATNYTFTVTSDYNGAYVMVTFVAATATTATQITSLSEITNLETGNYELAADIDASGSNLGEFKGTLDGKNFTIRHLNHPLFASTDGAIIRNINFEGVNISTGVDNGAITSCAKGATRIYNCGILPTTTEYDADGNVIGFLGSNVGGSGNVGSLVGKLEGTARVINCFSYANITGGTTVGGIVGNNTETTTSASLNTMVMNCIFYGDITGGSSKAPIYNGQIITNRGDKNGVSNFNYFWEGASYVQNKQIDANKYNCALAAETRYLQRFEFYRHLLNSNRELAAWWASTSTTPSPNVTKSEMLKWVLDKSVAPYPILKEQGYYPSVVNHISAKISSSDNSSVVDYTASTAPETPETQKTLTVNISGTGITTPSLTLPITDKDPNNYNFNYHTVQLPYFNDVGTGNYQNGQVVTGWKIVSMSKSAGSFTTGTDATATVTDGVISLTTPYNFADRNCTAKDIYSSTNKRVFSQGAYFDVPDGVTSINIEPYWGKAVFIADASLDVVYNQNMNTAYNVPNVGGDDVRYTNGTSYTFTTKDGNITLPVYTKFGDLAGDDGALKALFPSTPSGTVYDNALVLVGNFHNLSLSSTESNLQYTIMSADFNHDNEPDYSYILRFDGSTGRLRVHPVRLDFLDAIGLGMAQKSTGGSGTYNFGIMQPLGWFECTNTGLFRVTQFEYDRKDRAEAPMILQGGIIEQWVTVAEKGTAVKAANAVSYYHVGGNVWFKEFHIGVHQDKTEKEFVTPHPPISVTGGDFDEFYLTGLYNTPDNNYPDNAECYINGGRFGKVAGTGMQGLGKAGGAGVSGGPTETGNIIWQIDNADIDEFYAGGINAAHIAEGNIYTVITNSRVDQFCGGPKFGDMNNTKKVVTNAKNCTFRTFFGAGYGGNSYNRRYPANYYEQLNYEWNTWLTGAASYDYSYDSKYNGVETRIDYQFIPRSNNQQNVARLFIDYVSFSLATTYDVTSILNGCTITTNKLGRLDLFDQCVGNFYGGGSLGKVNGPVKSTLTNCTVEGNVFGAGYSATLPTVNVMVNRFQREPSYDENTGAYTEAILPATTKYSWKHAETVNSDATAIDKTNHILYTTEDLTSLGKVTGNVILTIDGNTTLTDGKVMSVAKSVYGGGEESNVAGNTQVNITGGTITQNVFGGGKGVADNFMCDKAMVGNNGEGAGADLTTEENKIKGTKVTISNGTVNGNVYGGGEVGRVEWNTQVKIGVGTGDGPFSPIINGSVFGAGKGEKTHGYAALVRGNSTVTIQGDAKVRENVYGGGEQATVGRYWVKGINDNVTGAPTAPTDTPDEMPYQTMSGGKCTVVVQGSAQVGPDGDAPATATAGHVFGAGKGVTPDYNYNSEEAGDANKRALWSKRMVDYNSTKHTSEGIGTAWDYFEAYTEDQIADNTFKKYVWEYFVDDADPTAANYKTGKDKYFEFLQTLALVTGADVTIDGGGTVKGNVYGGSESGFVQDDTRVTIEGENCTIGTETYGNVFGGGKGLEQFAEAGKVKGNTEVAISGGTTNGNVYGGGELGNVGNYTETTDGRYVFNVGGKCTVSVTGGKVGADNNSDTEKGNVFGAGKGKAVTFKCEKAMAKETSVSISGGRVNGNVYGGGEVGRVEYDSEVTIGRKSTETTAGSGTGTPVINGCVFGAGRGVATHGYSALVRGNTRVTIEGATGSKVNGSVFGGGEIASVGRYGLNTENMPNILLGGGTCTLKVLGSVEIAGDVFGAGQGVDPGTFNNTGTDKAKMSRRMTVYTNSTEFKDDFTTKTGNTWEYYNENVTPKIVWEYYQDAGDYSDYLQTLALATAPDVTIDGNAQVKGSVFGGGELGLTKGSVTVTINNGTIGTLDSNNKRVAGTGDVYGGGSLADTNTTNKVGLKNDDDSPKYKDETTKEIDTKDVHPTTIVRLLGGVIYGDAYGGGLGRLAVNQVLYTATDEEVINGTKNVGDVKVAGVTAVEAVVMGDVLVDLNGTTTVDTDDDGGKTWTANSGTTMDPSEKGCIVGRVFGGNNLNGTPQKNVTVHVYATQNEGAETISDKLFFYYDNDEGGKTNIDDIDDVATLKDYLADMILKAGKVSIDVTSYQATHDNTSATAEVVKAAIVGLSGKISDKIADSTTPETQIRDLYNRMYDVRAVYGGGNEASYIPVSPYTTTNTTGSKSRVIIEGCGVTSIETVYGGGNAASVPETNVEVKSAWEIYQLFGGGNGKDKKSDGSDNPGADIGQYKNASNNNELYGTGNVNLNAEGGYIHELFGASNEKGAIKGKTTINNTQVGDCKLRIDKLYNAGRNADVEGNKIVILNCQPSTKIKEYYCGAENANVKGNVEVTITNGKFGKIFGGNNQSGAVLGHIILNVEETGCQTIEIDELYLCGNDATYSVYGYYVKTTETDGVGAPGETPDPTSEKLILLPRTSANDPHKPVKTFDANEKTWTVYTGENDDTFTPYAPPELNIVSATRIGKVFGGGFGENGDVYGNPTVNINMIKGTPNGNEAAALGRIGVNEDGSTTDCGVFGGGNAADVIGNTTVNIGTVPTVQLHESWTEADGYTLSAAKPVLGANILSNVYGGGNLADVTGNTFVNVCAVKSGDSYSAVDEGTAKVNIAGNVFGGGKGKADTFTCEKAMIGTNNKGLESNYTDGNTSVIIGNGTVNGSVYGGGEIGRVEMNTTVMIGLEEDTQEGGSGNSAPEINGNVFGAGKGLETHGYAALVRGNPTVTIQGDAKVLHSVYGGGEIASVARYDLSGGAPVALAQINGRYSGYCNVTVQGNAEIGPDGMRMYHADNEGNIAATDKPDDYGHVFAAGKGILPTVYDYVKPATNNQANYHIEGGYDIDQHMPKRMAFYKDKKSAYWEYADPDFDPTGVGEGDLATQNVWEYYSSEEEYFAFIETLALATQTNLTIGGKAFVKGSAYGGSENGTVQYNTNVTIQDHCQIGQGKEITTRYEDYSGGNLFNLTIPPVKSGSGSTAEYYNLECASWDYGKDTDRDGKDDLFAPYDPNANATTPLDKYPKVDAQDEAKSTEGGRRIATDGHTFYGNVFGGGSGSVPYFDTEKGISRYIMTAGQVKGNSNVTINGGHILTNVYGGCEATNVLGYAHITMSGGTLGVPRTLAQIDAHPVTCYLFGAGKGDQRVFFNKDTNVKDVVIEITGGKIFGSVFGGGEDGHVLRDVTMTIGQQTTTGEGDEAETTTSGPTIGNWGTSYVDGNVFGGGRGFGGDAYTAGNVAGSITMEIIDGRIYGSIYGGGRLGSVGYGLFDATTNNQPTPGYGTMRDDADTEAGFTDGTTGFFTNGRGHIDITISGGTIGNDYEYIIPNATNIAEANITETDISKWTTTTGGDWDKWKTHHHIPKTEFDASGHLTHTKGGNVFAGGMGRFHKLDGTYISAIDWWKLGCVKSTKLTITGGTIKSNVYGGGELGQVVGHHTTQNAANENINASTEIIIQGSNTQIGTEVKNGGTTEYTFGSVFGGGYGSLVEEIGSSNPKFIAGLVKEDTKIDMQNGAVKASIYGGGEMASVGESTTSEGTTTATGSTYVAVSGGTVGIEPITVSNSKRYFGGAKMGNVYGGGSGHNNTVRSGRILKNTNVTISGSDTRIYHNIYGGGAYGTVGDFDYSTGSDGKVTAVNGLATTGTGTGVARVTITGGIIGYDGKENGMVFGSSRGDIAEPGARDDFCAWVYDTHVTIGSLAEGTEGQEGYVPATAPQINGSVYGGGENGHTFNDTEVIIHSGTVGIEDGSPIDGLSGANYPTRGNVYGGGCGTDTYEVDDDNDEATPSKNYFNRLSGIVRGNTSVKMDGGHVVRSIYGGGAMGSVGVFSRSTTDASGIHLPGSINGITSGGKCTINISGGKVGPNNLTMPMNAGMVFGAGRGEMHDLTYYPNLERVVYVDQTDVTITGTAFIKGSVYGGSESGHVFGNTHVTIDGNCQIGCGYDKTFNNGEGKDLDRVYTTDEWAYDVTSDDTKFLYECNSWPFHAPYTPYDKFAKDTGYYDDAQNQSADNARPQGSDGHTFYGNVFGGGSGFEPYAPGKWLPTAGWVQGNTLVEIKGGHILTSVYGGNEMSDVGSGGVQKMTDLNNETPDMFYDITKPGGKCTVKMSGGTLGVPRTWQQIVDHPVTCYLFGAGKGDQRIFFNKTTNVKEVEIEISGGRIYGSVFGGGEDGHVMRDVKMTIKDGSTTTGEGEQAVTTTTSPIIGTWGTSYVDGNVFGGGRGFSGEALTAGNVGGSVNIDIQGGKMLGSIYGGGRLGSVGYGLYLVDEKIGKVKPYGVLRDDNVDDRGNTVEGFKRGYITINISGGTIGNDIEYKYNPTDADKQKMPSTQFDYQNHLTYTRGGNVFTGCMGRLYALDNSTLLPLWTKLGRCRQTELNITGGMIKSNVYGGAELGVVQENATVNITGGTVGTKVGEGENAYYYGSVFGSGKGSNDAITYPESTDKEDKKDISEAGTVEGNVMVELNKGVAESENKKGGVVHKIFGCNDMNGTPKGTVTVHVYATQKEDEESINDKADKAATAEAGIYDVEAVYGGGNLAAYVPTKAVTGSEEEKQLARCEVIIDGCGLTSIGTVYGGGNAASVPATNVTVYGTYEIGQVFGGGNGKDKLPSGSDNPGANVGYYSYPNAANDAYDTKENRATNYGYGSGKAHATIYGGTVHTVYGGSNTKGNVRKESRTTLEELGQCDYNVGDAFGGGNNADQDGDAILDVGCITGLDIAYGGASNADVNGDVILNLTNGTYGRVFGGNNLGGAIRGSILVNIEETGCNPIVIGELYCGGNEAAYSVYGYDASGNVLTSGSNPVADPVVNVKSFTSIGKIFGGGYGPTATLVGNPQVNVNVYQGKYCNTFKNKDNVIDDNAKIVGVHVKYPSDNDPQYETGYPVPKHVKGAIGAINDVFGGGNEAKVIGTPTVNIGTEAGEEVYAEVYVKTGESVEGYYTSSINAETGAVEYTATAATDVAVAGTTYYLKTVKAVDIRGNVYGGGNNADVQGDTNVVIGKKAE